MQLTPREFEAVRSEILHDMCKCAGTYDYLCDVAGVPTYTHAPIEGHVLAQMVHPPKPEGL